MRRGAPGLLPAQLSSFVGREAQLLELRRLLRGARLLTLTGPGGVGKTRLAWRLAELAQNRYTDGVYPVDLSAVRDPALVAAAVALALGIYEQLGRDTAEMLADALAERVALLLLDNCEQVLAAAAGLALPPDLPDAPPGPRALALLVGSEAVQLFIERAKAVHPAFARSPAAAPVVARICRALDGLPLAIELAAARVRVLGVEQIAARLNDRFRLLAGSGRSLPERQQTLCAAIDWSHALLSPAEQTLLRRLSVFAGGCLLETAEHVCARAELPAGAMLETLSGLVDNSLVSVDERDGEARCRMLESVRLYALEKARAAGEEPALRERHAAWCFDLATSWWQASPERPVRQLIAGFEAEHAELRAALDWAVDEGEGRQTAFLKAVNDLATFWQACGRTARHSGALGRPSPAWTAPPSAAARRTACGARRRTTATSSRFLKACAWPWARKRSPPYGRRAAPAPWRARCATPARMRPSWQRASGPRPSRPIGARPCGGAGPADRPN